MPDVAVIPAVDFPLYGLPAEYAVPRSVAHLEGRLGDPLLGVWLWHGRRPVATVDDPWLDVGTLVRDRYTPPSTAGRLDPVREAAFAATFVLVNLTMPAAEDRPADYTRNCVRFAEHQADRHEEWAAASWTVDGRPVAARVLTWAGAWAGLAAGVGDVDIVALGGGGRPSDLALDRVAESTAYGIDLTRPFVFPPEAADDADGELSDWPWTNDHAAVGDFGES